MKQELRTSSVAIICALCATVANGASSVRSLGGAGTFTSASAATAANTATSNPTSSVSSGIAPTRGGSVRVNPATTRTTAATAKTASTRTTGRVATSPRLSIGKYLGVSGANTGSSTLRTNTGVPAGTYADAETAAHMRGDVDNLLRMADEFQEQLDNKQDKLSAGDYIVIEDDEVSVKVDELTDALSDAFASVKQGAAIEIGTSNDDKKDLLWRFAGDGDDDWRVLTTADEIINSSNFNTTINNAINNAITDALDDYYTKSEVDDKFDDVFTDIGDTNDLETADKSNLVGAINEIRSTSADATAVGNTSELKTSVQTIVGAINEVRSYVLPETTGPVCNSESGLCVLTLDNAGVLRWVGVTDVTTGDYRDYNSNTNVTDLGTNTPVGTKIPAGI